jgi:hypothetical protein
VPRDAEWWLQTLGDSDERIKHNFIGSQWLCQKGGLNENIPNRERESGISEYLDDTVSFNLCFQVHLFLEKCHIFGFTTVPSIQARFSQRTGFSVWNLCIPDIPFWHCDPEKRFKISVQTSSRLSRSHSSVSNCNRSCTYQSKMPSSLSCLSIEWPLKIKDIFGRNIGKKPLPISKRFKAGGRCFVWSVRVENHHC